MADKVSKESVDYRQAPDGAQQRCGTCDMFNPGSGVETCDLVEGSIDYDHVCDRWIPITLKETKSVTQTIEVTERPVYGPGSRQSFYRDLYFTSGLSSASGWEVDEARDRLRVYAQRSERTLRFETRAMTSGTASGGAFVTPEYLVDDFALYLSPLSSFAAQCTDVPDDGVGLQMNVPGISAGSGTGQQGAENQGTGGTDAAAGYLTAALVTQVGSQPVSQQLIDRAGPLGFDKVMSMQLGDQLRAAVDTYVVKQAIANGTAVAGAATFSVPNLWGDIQKAGEQMLDANGNELMPTHFYAIPKQIQFFLAQVDGQQRPLAIPTPNGMWTPDKTQPSGQPAAGATGHNVLGLQVYFDGNIPPATGGVNAQLLVARPSEFFVQCSEPYFRVVQEGLASSLTTLVQAYCYVGVVARHSTACQVITGNGYPLAVSFV